MKCPASSKINYQVISIYKYHRPKFKCKFDLSGRVCWRFCSICYHLFGAASLIYLASSILCWLMLKFRQQLLKCPESAMANRGLFIQRVFRISSCNGCKDLFFFLLRTTDIPLENRRIASSLAFFYLISCKETSLLLLFAAIGVWNLIFGLTSVGHPCSVVFELFGTGHVTVERCH